jgi:hypothetical protein
MTQAEDRILKLCKKTPIDQSIIVDALMKTGKFTSRNGARVSASRNIAKLKAKKLVKTISKKGERGIKENLVQLV